MADTTRTTGTTDNHVQQLGLRNHAVAFDGSVAGGRLMQYALCEN